MNTDIDPKFRLFEARPTRMNIVSTEVETIEPTHIADRYPGNVKFRVNSSNVFFTDTKIMMKMAFAIRCKTATGHRDLVEGDNVGIVNSFASACFESMSVSMNQIPVETHGNFSYPYSAYLRQLLSTSSAYKKEYACHMTGFVLDTGDFDNATGDNAGYAARKKSTKGSSLVTMLAEMSWDLGNSFKVLPPGVSLDISFSHSPEAFKLMGAASEDAEFFVSFSRISLIVNRYALQQRIVNDYQQRLASNQPVEIGFTRLAVSGPYEAAAGQTQMRQLVTLSRLPSVALIIMNSADVGSKLTSNCFKLDHFNVSRARLYIDGRFIPYNDEMSQILLEVDQPFAQLKGLHWYRELMEVAGVGYNFSPGITYSQFCNGMSVLAIPISADRLSRDVNTMTSSGRMELHLDFFKALSKNIHVRVVGVFEDQLKITKDNKIELSYLPGNF